MNVSIYSYVRYLNQKNLAPTYTNYFGVTSTLQQRQDVQINKVQIKFLGWVLNPELRYFLYAWSSNANQGQAAQVVLAGNLSYRFNKYFTLAGGIAALPGVRSTEGQFPFWLGVDERLITDEFFRPSYTSGIWARGDLTNKLRYFAMIGNNLSTLGVSAAQLDNAFNTISSMLEWDPTTGEFGAGFGDFENHQKLATRFAGHYTTSTESAQEQPGQDSFENTQIRLSDGGVIFTPNLFGPGITVNTLRYQMASVSMVVSNITGGRSRVKVTGGGSTISRAQERRDFLRATTRAISSSSRRCQSRRHCSCIRVGHTSSASTAIHTMRVLERTGSRIRTAYCAGIQRPCICSARLWVIRQYRFRWAVKAGCSIRRWSWPSRGTKQLI